MWKPRATSSANAPTTANNQPGDHRHRPFSRGQCATHTHIHHSKSLKLQNTPLGLRLLHDFLRVGCVVWLCALFVCEHCSLLGGTSVKKNAIVCCIVHMRERAHATNFTRATNGWNQQANQTGHVETVWDGGTTARPITFITQYVREFFVLPRRFFILLYCVDFLSPCSWREAVNRFELGEIGSGQGRGAERRAEDGGKGIAIEA